MNLQRLCQRAAALREVPLQRVLILRGALPDRRDRSKWHTEQGPLSVSGPKFMNWQQGRGGGGAIDLVMHLADVDFLAAVAWLQEHLATDCLAPGRKQPSVPSDRPLRLPVPDQRMLARVREYLTERRHLQPSLLEPLFESGRLYADSRANAVFLLVAGKANRPVGAELRGTGLRPWRGMAPGSRKDLGYFWIGHKGCRQIVLCESAIDSISCFQMQPHLICISTCGLTTHPRWLNGLIGRGYRIYCGFDADGPGEAAANRLIGHHPTIKRLRPPAHDWNDALASGG